MDASKQKEIARKGGQAAHAKGTAHEFSAEEARAAGRKGGERVSANRSHMAEIGRLGGKSSAGRRRTVAPEGEAAVATSRVKADSSADARDSEDETKTNA